MNPSSEPNMNPFNNSPAKPRGFAAMSPERQKQIARIGGIAAHKKGTAHEFSPVEASAAGRKGGISVSRDPSHMALIGRKGGLARKHSRSDNSASASSRETQQNTQNTLN